MHSDVLREDFTPTGVRSQMQKRNSKKSKRLMQFSRMQKSAHITTDLVTMVRQVTHSVAFLVEDLTSIWKIFSVVISSRASSEVGAAGPVNVKDPIFSFDTALRWRLS